MSDLMSKQSILSHFLEKISQLSDNFILFISI
jgi:hypothetical protein